MTYVYAAIAALCALLGGYVWHEFDQVRYDKLDKEFTAYKDESTANALKAKAQSDAETLALQQRADAAEKAHVQEDASTATYRDAHPVVDVRLCLQATSGAGLPQAPASTTGLSGTSPTASHVQPVPAPDSGVRSGSGPDIGGLLDFLAGRADSVSAQLRGYQAR